MKDQFHNSFEVLQSFTQGRIFKSDFNNPARKKNTSIRKNNFISELCLEIIKLSGNLVLKCLNHPVFVHDDNLENSDLYTSTNSQLIDGNLYWKSHNLKIQKILNSFLVPEIYNSLQIKSFIKEFHHSYSKFFLPNQYSFDLIANNLKATAAITNSIYYETRNKGSHFPEYYLNSTNAPKIKTELFSTRLLIVKCQLVGVRNYISNYQDNFSINEVIRITNYFALLSSVIMKYCLSFFELTDANALLNFTNSFFLILPGSFKKDLDDCILYINTVLAQTFYGYIYFSCVNESIRVDELEDLKCKWNKLSEQHEHNVNNMFSDINYKNIFKPFTKSEFDFSIKSVNITTDTNKISINSDYHNSHTNIKKYNNGNAVFKAFGYETTLQVIQDFKQRSNKFYNRDLNKDSTNINVKSPCITTFNNYAIMEVMFENPDHSINDLYIEQNVLTLIKHYKTKEDTINNFLLLTEKCSRNNTGYFKDVHIIYKSFHELIIVGSLEKLIRVAKKRYFISDRDQIGSHQIPVFMNISLLNKDNSFRHTIQNSQLIINKLKLNEKHANKIVLFNTELTIYEFKQTIKLAELIISIISKEAVKDKKEIIIKSLYKCSHKLGELVNNSAEGYLYFEELYRFIYYISNIDAIETDHRNSLISIINDIIKNSLLGNGKTVNGSIVTIACKIADIITGDK